MPIGLFEAVAAGFEQRIGPTRLTSRVETSGPEPGTDPFATGEVDIGFLCAPTWRWLASTGSAEVAAAPVFDDPRTEDQPVYFSDVVVAEHHPARTVADLVHARVAYNDPCSLSGYFSLRQRVAAIGRVDLVSEWLCTGGHHASLDAVLDGRVDVAAIDTNTLRQRQAGIGGRIRVIETLGPYPSQPVVVRTALEGDVRAAIVETLAELRPVDHGVSRFETDLTRWRAELDRWARSTL